MDIGTHTDTQTHTVVGAETETENISGKKLSYNAISQDTTSNNGGPELCLTLFTFKGIISKLH